MCVNIMCMRKCEHNLFLYMLRLVIGVLSVSCHLWAMQAGVPECYWVNRATTALLSLSPLHSAHDPEQDIWKLLSIVMSMDTCLWGWNQYMFSSFWTFHCHKNTLVHNVVGKTSVNKWSCTCTYYYACYPLTETSYPSTVRPAGTVIESFTTSTLTSRCMGIHNVHVNAHRTENINCSTSISTIVHSSATNGPGPSAIVCD